MGSKTDNFTQCKLRKGAHFLVSWLPSDKVKKGSFVMLKDSESDNMKGPWEIVEVWGSTSAAVVEIGKSEHRHHRSVTDV